MNVPLCLASPVISILGANPMARHWAFPLPSGWSPSPTTHSLFLLALRGSPLFCKSGLKEGDLSSAFYPSPLR